MWGCAGRTIVNHAGFATNVISCPHIDVCSAIRSLRKGLVYEITTNGILLVGLNTCIQNRRRIRS